MFPLSIIERKTSIPPITFVLPEELGPYIAAEDNAFISLPFISFFIKLYSKSFIDAGIITKSISSLNDLKFFILNSNSILFSFQLATLLQVLIYYTIIMLLKSMKYAYFLHF